MAAPAALWALLSALAGLAPGPAGASQLPLLVWSTERSLWAPPALPAGRALSEPELQQLLEPGLRRGPRTVLLFLQDQLSVDDLTAFGAVFGNEPNGAFSKLRDALGSAGSTLSLPRVSGSAAAALPHTLQRALGAPAPLSLPGGALGGLRNRTEPTESGPGEPAVLLVGLPHSRGSGLMGPREALSRNDAVLGEVLQVLREEQLPYTALFTGRAAAPPPAQPPPHFGLPRRSLLAEGEGPEAPPPPPALAPPGGPQNSALGPERDGDARGAPPGPDPPNLRPRGLRGAGGVLVEPPRGSVGSALPGRVWGPPEPHVRSPPCVVPGLGPLVGVAGRAVTHARPRPPRAVPGPRRRRPLPPRVALRGFGDPRAPPAAPPPAGARPPLGAPHPGPAGSGLQRLRGRFWGGLGLRRLLWGGGVDGAALGGAPARGAPPGGGGSCWGCAPWIASMTPEGPPCPCPWAMGVANGDKQPTRVSRCEWAWPHQAAPSPSRNPKQAAGRG
ncbi:V-type proton ATPase subunit S1 [Ammospiza caudacuta]|uniref:V-type proton ATPase subunit S1 n=1 Tax=Ammospiza caudacuta TaxID=2857398 RepID=UPI0027390317|nr:V-type proton ATPase subunit S1 [Ammospiza caudacuta]